MQKFNQIILAIALAASVITLGAVSSRAHAAKLNLGQAGCENTANLVYKIASARDAKTMTKADVIKWNDDAAADAIAKGQNPKMVATYHKFLAWVIDVIYSNDALRLAPQALAQDFFGACMANGGVVDMGEEV